MWRLDAAVEAGVPGHVLCCVAPGAPAAGGRNSQRVSQAGAGRTPRAPGARTAAAGVTRARARPPEAAAPPRAAPHGPSAERTAGAAPPRPRRPRPAARAASCREAPGAPGWRPEGVGPCGRRRRCRAWRRLVCRGRWRPRAPWGLFLERSALPLSKETAHAGCRLSLGPGCPRRPPGTLQTCSNQRSHLCSARPQEVGK